jgi:signal transduction histidine kinase
MIHSSFSPAIGPQRLARMLGISRQLNSATSVDELLKLIISEAAALIGAESASILLLDPHTRELRFKAVSGEMPAELRNLLVPLEGSIAGTILRTNQPHIVADVKDNPGWNPEVDSAINFQTTAILGVPMHDGAGEAIGVLEALNKLNGEPFSEDDILVLSTLADLAGAAVAKAQLFEEVEKAYQKLNELDRLKSDFIALASHELRTPLSVILGYVSFLREDADEQTGEHLDQVLKAAVRLRSLIQDMINLRYVEAGQTNLNQRTLDVAELIRQVVHDRDETAVAKQQTVHLHLPPQPVRIQADEEMLELMLSNLYSNAVKFTPEGGRIDIGAAKRGDEVWIYVRDSGIGIPQEQLERIFDKFYQVEPHIRRRYEGMGIGLTIVKELAQLHGGRIWAKSEPGQGSEFFIALPQVWGQE